MYVKQNSISEVNFLASSKFQNYTRQVSNVGISANSKGRKIIPAGTVYKNSNGVAIGLLFHDVDVTEGPSECAVMYQGTVISSRLPATVSAQDKATMKGIIFKDEYESQSPSSPVTPATYTLTITQAEDTTVSVTRNGVALETGATLTEGDILVISVTGGTITVNSTAFVSGGVLPVSQNVTVVSTKSV